MCGHAVSGDSEPAPIAHSEPGKREVERAASQPSAAATAARVDEAKRRRAAVAAYAAVVRASNRRRIAAKLDRLSASADSSSKSLRCHSAFRSLRWSRGVLLRFGMVALLALLITTGALFIDSDQTAALRTDGHSGVISAVAWGKDAGARGLGQLEGACRIVVERIRPAWINPAPTESVESAGGGDGAGGGGIELSWRRLHPVNTSPAARATADSTPKSR